MPRRKKASAATAAAANDNNDGNGADGNEKKKEFQEPKIKWKKSKARALLYRDFLDGHVPLAARDAEGNFTMTYDQVYAMREEYKLYDRAKFPSRLNSLREIVTKIVSRKNIDEEAFERYRSNHEPSLMSHKGYPEWQGSEAQMLLKDDLKENRHVGKTYRQVWESREEYFSVFPFTPFKHKIRQEIRTAKYIFTMKMKYAEQVAS